MAFKIAVGSQKGGVAKTTTALSLGASLVEMGHSVLLIDLDPQANLTMSLGFDPETMRRMVGDVLLDQGTLLSVSRESPVFNLDLVPANPGLLVLDKVLYGRSGYEYRLKTHLDNDAGHHDIIIFDCPPSFGTLTMNALTAADFLIVPVQCEYYAARSLRGYLNLVSLVNRRTNPYLQYRMLVTMFDKRNRVSHVIFKQLRNGFGDCLFETFIGIDTKLRESPVFGKPITQYAPTARSAAQYRALASELMNREKT
jgi:chromosome partitioning protein